MVILFCNTKKKFGGLYCCYYTMIVKAGKYKGFPDFQVIHKLLCRVYFYKSHQLCCLNMYSTTVNTCCIILQLYKKIIVHVCEIIQVISSALLILFALIDV